MRYTSTSITYNVIEVLASLLTLALCPLLLRTRHPGDAARCERAHLSSLAVWKRRLIAFVEG